MPTDNLDKGLHSNRPTATRGNEDKFWLSVDTGDLYVSDGSDWIAVGGGSGGGGEFATVAQNITPQSIPDATPTAVEYDTVVSDDAGYYSALNPDLLTVPVGSDGLFEISGAVSPAGPSLGNDYSVSVRVNLTDIQDIFSFGATLGNWLIQVTDVPVRLVAGDTVQLMFTHNEGAALNMNTDYAGNFLTLRRVGD